MLMKLRIFKEFYKIVKFLKNLYNYSYNLFCLMKSQI